jgi:hypothetical protein
MKEARLAEMGTMEIDARKEYSMGWWAEPTNPFILLSDPPMATHITTTTSVQ